MRKNPDINELFDKFLKSKEKGLKQIEGLKKSITEKLDVEIGKLYKQKDFITEIFLRKIELKKYKLSVWEKIRNTKFPANVKYLFSAPFIYMMIVPAIIMHLFLEVYHQIGFRIYRIPRVKAKEYFIFDRRMLPYLNWLEKFNCLYCSYFNCLVSYLSEIAGRTERYWCPIKHSKKMINPHNQYDKFVEYSDAKNLRKEWQKLRKFE